MRPTKLALFFFALLGHEMEKRKKVLPLMTENSCYFANYESGNDHLNWYVFRYIFQYSNTAVKAGGREKNLTVLAKIISLYLLFSIFFTAPIILSKSKNVL